MNNQNKVSKRQLVWGIVLAAIGVVGLSEAGGKGGVYYVVCFVLLIVGGVLIILQVISKKKAREAQRLKDEENWDLDEARRRTEEARLKAEEARYNAQANRHEQELNAVKTCKNCGAIGKGNYCEYCGSKLE